MTFEKITLFLIIYFSGLVLGYTLRSMAEERERRKQFKEKMEQLKEEIDQFKEASEDDI